MEAQRGEVSRLSRGRAWMWRRVCLRASSQPRAPKQSRARATPAQVGSAQDVDSRDMSSNPRRKVYVPGTQPFRKLKEANGVEEDKESEPPLLWPGHLEAVPRVLG